MNDESELKKNSYFITHNSELGAAAWEIQR